jgi:hypothetical protein
MASRKPMLLSRFERVFLLRFAARRCLALLFQAAAAQHSIMAYLLRLKTTLFSIFPRNASLSAWLAWATPLLTRWLTLDRGILCCR